MALIQQTLISEIRKIADQEYSGFEGFPPSTEQVALRWSNAVDLYGKQIIPPSTSSEQAKEAFRQVMLGVDVGSGNAFIVMKQAFITYASTLGLGMAPLFTATPPPGPLLLESIAPIGLGGGTSEQCSIALGQIIHTWFKTGIAINSTSGASVNWN